MAKETKNKTNIHEGHRARLKKKFLDSGFSVFEEHEILELVLFYSIPRMDTNEIAHHLISRFGSIKNVLSAPISELETVSGIGENSAVLLKLLNALLREDLFSRGNNNALDSSENVGKFIAPYFTDLSVENILVIALDQSLRPISAKKFGEGTESIANLAPTSVAKFLVMSGAHSAILAHNHPNGTAIPSIADIRSTSALKSALDVVGIKLIDHIIVVPNDFVSIRDSGDNIYTTIY